MGGEGVGWHFGGSGVAPPATGKGGRGAGVGQGRVALLVEWFTWRLCWSRCWAGGEGRGRGVGVLAHGEERGGGEGGGTGLAHGGEGRGVWGGG